MERGASVWARALVAVGALWGVAGGSGWAWADPTSREFTFQGKLTQNGTSVDGAADVRFTLWNAAAGGVQVGPVLAVDGAAVRQGLVRALLDFGSGAFNGESRWVEVQARVPAGVGSWETLAPRQEVTPTPYALYALNPGPAGPTGPAGPPGPPGTTQWAGLTGIPPGFADGVDDVGPVQAVGSGLTVAGGVLSVVPGGVQGPMLAAGAVGTEAIADGAVTPAKVADRLRTVFVPGGAMVFESGGGPGVAQGSGPTAVWARSLGDMQEGVSFTVQVPADYAGSGVPWLSAPRMTLLWSSDDPRPVSLDIAWRRVAEMAGGDAGNTVRYSVRPGVGPAPGDSTVVSRESNPARSVVAQVVPDPGEGDVWGGPASAWQPGDVIVVTVFRRGTEDPNTGRVSLLGVSIEYLADQ